jgi:hypothetical protein
MSEGIHICIKSNTCGLRGLITAGARTAGQLRLQRRSILDCPVSARCRCAEINNLASTGFEEARRVLARRYGA